ncbi:MAG: hypothetical protein RR853_09335 [Aurantimicrobium sp.]|uniref:hypothetical protein n=1 Tax=Aurantimicrobium sp. TaxID=1930784 RepID=UPI002FC7A93B
MSDRSEFQGGGVMPNGVFPKGNDALTPSDKLRLMSTTGQTEDSRAKVDPGFWYGNEYFDINEKPPVDRDRIRRERQNRREEGRRYRESPR